MLGYVKKAREASALALSMGLTSPLMLKRTWVEGFNASGFSMNREPRPPPASEQA